MEHNPYQSPVGDTTEAPEPPKNLKRLGGWLLLVGFVVIATPVRIVMELYPIYSNLLKDGTWAALTTPGSAMYSPMWMPVLIGEIVLNAVLFLGWLYITFLFFSKKRAFPTWFIGIMLFTLVFLVAEWLLISHMAPGQADFDTDAKKEIARSVFQILIWVPYILISKRVKETFVG